MKSPFPGLDPYLETYWRDVHHSLITYARDQLQPNLPDHLRARVEERVFVEVEEGQGLVVYPDLHVVERKTSWAPSTGAGSGGLAVEPIVLELASEPVTQSFIEILDVGTGNKVITVIEFLSPTNKLPGEGQDLYLKKQKDMRAAAVSLVEIDLTRAGDRASVLPLHRIPIKHRTTYQVLVRRGWKPTLGEIYQIPLKEPLPAIRIPLRQDDPDVLLDLQALIELCYRNGRYDDLNYQAGPQPPLTPEEAGWANELLRSKGLRR